MIYKIKCHSRSAAAYYSCLNNYSNSREGEVKMYKKYLIIIVFILTALCITSYADEVKTGNLNGDIEQTDFNEVTNNTYLDTSSNVEQSDSSNSDTSMSQYFTIENNEVVNEDEETNTAIESPDILTDTDYTILRYGVQNDGAYGYLQAKLEFQLNGNIGESLDHIIINNQQISVTSDENNQIIVYYDKKPIAYSRKQGYEVKFPKLQGNYTIDGTFSVVLVKDEQIDSSICFTLVENERSNILTTANSEDVIVTNNILCDGKTFNSKLKQLTSGVSTFNFTSAPITYVDAIASSLPLVDVSLNQDEGSSFLCLQGNNVFIVNRQNETPILNRYCGYMFDSLSNCNSVNLTSLDGNNTQKLDNMFSNMQNCYSITLPNSMPNVYDVGAIFYANKDIEVIDLTNINGWAGIQYGISMFGYCTNLKRILLPEKINTAPATNLAAMFDNCVNLEYVDLNLIETDQNTDFRSMFYNTKKLANIDISTWNTSNGILFDSMFSESVGLTVNTCNNLNVSNGTSFSYMFCNCDSNITTLDISNLDISNAVSMWMMFAHNSNLTKIVLPDCSLSNLETLYCLCQENNNLTNINFEVIKNTSSLKDISGIFLNCNSLTVIDVSGIISNNIEKATSAFQGCTSLIKIDNCHWTLPKLVLANCMFTYCSKLEELDVSNWGMQSCENIGMIFYDCRVLKELDVSKWKANSLREMRQAFSNCQKITKLDCRGFNTNNVTNLREVFAYCKSLTELDISTWDTSDVDSLKGTFYYCECLPSIPVDNFNTSKVTTMNSTFGYCKSLRSIDVSKWDTSNVDEMTEMFYLCQALSSIQCENWDTQSLVGMAGIFSCCSSLKQVDIHNWNTINVINMKEAFYGGISLQSININGIDTSNVVTMEGMFCGIPGITIDIRSFDTRKVQNFGGMFDIWGKEVGADRFNRVIKYGSLFLPTSGTNFTAMLDDVPETQYPNWSAYGTWSAGTFIKN